MSRQELFIMSECNIDFGCPSYHYAGCPPYSTQVTHIVYTQCSHTHTHINCTYNNISPFLTLTGSLRPFPSHRLRPLPDPSGPFLHTVFDSFRILPTFLLKIQTPMHAHSLLVSLKIWINKITLTSSIKNCHPPTCMLITVRVNKRVIIKQHICPHHSKSLTHIKYVN